jgi:hypothetical protein
MRKLIYSLTFILLSSCSTCLLSQIPPQHVYVASGCSVALPDYRTKITATDNCEVASFTQTPAPGFMLTPTNKTATVIVKATDGSGNFRQVTFTVTLTDTIKPVLNIDPSLLAYNIDQIKEMYNIADRAVSYVERSFDNVYPYGSPEAKNQADSSYFKKELIIYTSPGFAFTGKGNRTITFKDAE